MPVSCGGDQSITVKQIKFHPVPAVKGRFFPWTVRVVVTLLKMCPNVLLIDREQVRAFIGSSVKPGKMVDSQYIDMDIPPVNVS